MISRIIKEHWLSIVAFVFVFTVLLIDLTPDLTFINKSLDSVEFIFCAKYFYVAHQMSVPLYLLVSHFFLMIPFGTEAWRMGLISLLSTMVACWFIYKIIRQQLPNKKYFAVLGVLIYGLSALVISQSTVVQTYSSIAMCAVGAYYFAITKRWKLVGVMVGIGLAIHVLVGLVFIILLVFFKEYRNNWKAILITVSFLLFYLYIPLRSGVTPDLLDRNGSSGLVDAFLNLITVVTYFGGTLSIWELPKRILDMIGVVGISIGIVAIVPLVKYFWSRSFFKNPLFWLSGIPIIIYVSNLDAQTYDYMMLAIPFIVIAICLGLDKFKNHKVLSVAIVAVVIVVGIFNGWYFNIGSTLDKNLSVSNLYYNEFSKMSNGSILICSNLPKGTNLSLVSKYNKEYDINIKEVDASELWDSEYLDKLQNNGIELIANSNTSETTQSIITLNQNVWVMKLINPEVYEFEIVKAENTNQIINLQEKNTEIKWQINPSNPYKILTSSPYLTEWQNAILSKYNFRLIALAVGVLVVVSITIYKNIAKKDEYSEKLS
jgi:hypothetical protein